MKAIALFVNDAAHARRVVSKVMEPAGPDRWILVACAPRLARHAGRWVSKAARAQWQQRWAAELCGQIEPGLGARPGRDIERVLARGPLIELAQRLASRWPCLQIVDARQPRVGQMLEPLAPGQAPTQAWVAPLAVTTGLSAMLTLAD